ncbi:hypothetical protein GQ55_3G120700 [Panicum hallii var. hallii]|uniref:Uncharacterized protein n=1 Tax=Panicum hallii var. hallii TaxID=1504633 RepID=A0A2T7E8J4_9POAL|nr:hypothetical protein GQ55_3G120700 [Panicum hallii var. hallii]
MYLWAFCGMQNIRFTDSEHKNGSNGKMHSGNSFVQFIWLDLVGWILNSWVCNRARLIDHP